MWEKCIFTNKTSIFQKYVFGVTWCVFICCIITSISLTYLMCTVYIYSEKHLTGSVCRLNKIAKNENDKLQSELSIEKEKKTS